MLAQLPFVEHYFPLNSRDLERHQEDEPKRAEFIFQKPREKKSVLIERTIKATSIDPNSFNLTASEPTLITDIFANLGTQSGL